MSGWAQRYLVLTIADASVLKGAAQAFLAQEQKRARPREWPCLERAIEAVRAEYRRTEHVVCSTCGGCRYGEACCLSTCQCEARVATWAP